MLTVRRKKQREKEEKNNNKRKTRARARTHSYAFVSVERPLTLHFVVGVFFLCVLLPLFFSPLPNPSSLPPPSSPRPTRLSPSSLRLTRPMKNAYFFLPFFFFFLHDTIMPSNAIFEAFAPGLYHHLWCKSKRIPSFLILFFAVGHWPIDETYLKIGSLNSRFLYVLNVQSVSICTGEFTRKINARS